METIEKKDKVQRAAIENWIKAEKKGTCEVITGLGKTFISLHALYTMPKNSDIHLFLAETVGRETDLKRDVEKYNEIFGRDVFKDYNLEFYCYQTVYKWKDREFGLVIADEIHDSLTPSYSQFYYNNSYKAIIGLSATVDRSTEYKVDEKVFKKGDLLDEIAPVCFRYNLKKAAKESTTRDLDIYVIMHKLEDKKKTIKAGNAKTSFLQTEKAAYDYWDSRHKRSFFILDEATKELQIRITSSKRSNILYNLNSKIPVVKKLLEALDSKTIVFGNSLDALLKVTPNVVSSRNSEDENKRIRDAFESGRTKTIGSFKKLKQGANLEGGLDNCVMMSYYSTSKDLIQRIGRLRDNGEKGNIFIILTQGTQEEVWLEKMLEDVRHYNIMYCPDVDFAIKKLKK